MSNKGAIKKTPVTRNIKTKSKNVLPNEDLEKGGKLESRRTRMSQNLEQKGDGDKYTRLASTSVKSNTKESIKSLPNKSIKESTLSKTNSSTSRTATKDTPTARTKKSTSNNVARTKSTGKDQAGYSEKRGISTVYVPPSLKSKLNAKTDKTVSSVSNVKEKVKRSNMLQESKTGTIPRERRLSRTLSPSEVKMLHSIAKNSTSLQKKNEPKTNSVETSEVDKDYSYEDDFEDYESDFQECTDSETSLISEASNGSQSNLQLEPIELHSEQRKTVNSAENQRAEEEHMHDSGHYELAEARKRAARVESIIANQSKSSPLLELRQPVNKAFSNSEDRPSENKSLPLSTDEGFEDSRSGDFAKSPPLSQISFIDFRNTKEVEAIKKPKKPLSRGEELLEMIKLDVMEWSLLECTPIPYDEFIRSYGKLNAQQMSTQTGEDNIDIEIQTEKITLKNKWTQFPVTCRTNLQTKEDIDLFRMDQLGTGSDDADETNSLSTPSFDILRLSEFLNRAGGVMLSLLEERKLGGNVFKNENDKLPFSDGVLKLSVNSVTFLAGRPVTIIHYSEVLSKILLTIHSPAEEEIETSSKQDYITDCCIGCVWNISEPSMPIKLFYSSCPITTCCFHLTNYNVVFAGLQDGSMSLWNLKEDEMWHQKVTDKANELDWIIRTPTYTTAGNEKHKSSSKIVTIRILSKIEEKTYEEHDNRFVPIQICSLNEEGCLVIWSVLRNMAVNIDDLGLSYWGDIKLIKSQEIFLQSHIGKKKTNAAAFIDMHVDCIDTNSLYVATNTTNILHTTCIGNKTNPTSYKTYDTRPSGNVTCIEVCPFEQSFFLVGCDDGTIRLHSLNTEKPILQLQDENCKARVRALQWSKSKPFTIYVLDNNSRIHIWDLNDSDIQASCTINMQEWGHVTSMQLSSCKIQRDMTHQYLALGTETGNVEIHKLRTNFHYTKKEEYMQELNMFMRYIAIL